MKFPVEKQVPILRFVACNGRLLLVAVLFCVLQHTFARSNCPSQGPRLTAEEYCQLYGAKAQQQMQLYGIPASITLAQGMYESAYGSSYLAVVARNHFGIKAYRGWSGPTVNCDDDSRNEPFCRFSTVEEGFEYHSKFLKENARYRSLFSLGKTDYKAWAKGLSKCGYATNPQYASQLISIIERYNLTVYDSGKAVGGKTSGSTKTSKASKRSKSSKTAKSKTAKASKSTKSSQPQMTHKLYVTAEKGGLRYILAKQGDTLDALSDELCVTEHRLRRWNDFPKGYQLREGEVVYLERKHAKADAQYPSHVVQAGESLLSISQLYGVRVSSLMKLNGLSQGSLSVGQTLKLR